MKKRLCTVIATALAAALHAAVPIAWTATPASPPFAPPPVPHGSAVEFAVTLKGFTTPPIASGADIRLWYQTNGMGSVWFSAPASLASNVVTASWGPAQDCGADRYALFFGAPSNVFASAVLRLTHAPGFVPTELSPPIQRLDFAAVEIANAPYYTKPETDAKIVELAPVPGDYASVSNRAMQISMPDDEGHPPWEFNPMFKGRAEYATWSEYLFQVQSPYALVLNNERWGMRYGYSSQFYQYFPFAYLSEVASATNDLHTSFAHTISSSAAASTNYTDAATNAIPRNFLPRTGGTLSGGITFDYGYHGGVALYAASPVSLSFHSTYSDYSDSYANLDLSRIPTSEPYYGWSEIAFLSDIPDLSSYATQETVTNIVSALSLAPPSAPETTAALRWRADGTACVVTVAAAGTLTASTNNWTEGQAVMATITLASGASVASNIELVGYGAWPTDTAFVACCYRIGQKVYVVPSTTL